MIEFVLWLWVPAGLALVSVGRLTALPLTRMRLAFALASIAILTIGVGLALAGRGVAVSVPTSLIAAASFLAPVIYVLLRRRA